MNSIYLPEQALGFGGRAPADGPRTLRRRLHNLKWPSEDRLGLGASLRLDLNPDRTWLTVSLCRLATACQPDGTSVSEDVAAVGVRVPSTMRIVVGLPAQLRPTIAST